MEVTLVGLAGLPSVAEFTRNDVDYTSNLLGGLIFPFLQTLLVAPLLVVSLSSSIFYFVPCFVCVVITMLILLVCTEGFPSIVVYIRVDANVR